MKKMIDKDGEDTGVYRWEDPETGEVEYMSKKEYDDRKWNEEVWQAEKSGK